MRFFSPGMRSSKVRYWPGTANRLFTTFSHSKHFSLAGGAACQSCHALDAKAEYAKFFSSEVEASATPPAITFQSNFSPIPKTLCADCHKREVAATTARSAIVITRPGLQTICFDRSGFEVARVERGCATIAQFKRCDSDTLAQNRRWATRRKTPNHLGQKTYT